MSKTISLTQTLTDQIKQIEVAIADAERDLIEQQQENSEFTEALKLLSLGVDKFVPEGRVPLMDAVVEHLNEASNQSDRQYRWEVANKALATGQQAASSLQYKLYELRRQLAIALEEVDWQTNYAPYIENYRSGFTMPSPQVVKEQKITAIQKDIAEKKDKLQRLKAWLNQPQGNRDYLPYSGNPESESEYLEVAIPALQKQLEALIVEPLSVDKSYDAGLREYVKARVKMEPILASFLQAQSQYLSALEEFKQAIAIHPIAVQFEPVALELPRIVEAETSIKLAAKPVTQRLR